MITDTDLQKRLIYLLELSNIDLFNTVACKLYDNPVCCKTHFKQKLIIIRDAGGDKAVVENSEVKAFVNKDHLVTNFINSDFISELFSIHNEDIIKIKGSDVARHLTYGISTEEGVFISNLEIILTYLKSFVILDYTAIAEPLIDLIQELKLNYKSQCIVYRPVFTNPTNHQTYQAINKAIRTILVDDNNAGYIVNLILEAYIFNNPSYKGKVDWLVEQANYISYLASKYSHYRFLQIHHSTQKAVDINPELHAVFQFDKSVTDIKLVKWYTTEFVEYHAARAVSSEKHSIRDIGRFERTTIGKIINECQELAIDSPDHPKFEEFMNTVYSLIDDRLSLKQKYHN